MQRLDAESIPRKEQQPSALVPDRVCEHAVQPPHALRAPFLVRVKDHLTVGSRREDVACPLEFLPQPPEVVDLAVEGKPQGTGAVGHGLPARRREVDDRQSAVAEAHRGVRVHVDACVVRAPMHHRVPRPHDVLGADAARLSHLSHDAAHGSYAARLAPSRADAALSSSRISDRSPGVSRPLTPSPIRYAARPATVPTIGWLPPRIRATRNAPKVTVPSRSTSPPRFGSSTRRRTKNHCRTPYSAIPSPMAKAAPWMPSAGTRSSWSSGATARQMRFTRRSATCQPLAKSTFEMMQAIA